MSSTSTSTASATTPLLPIPSTTLVPSTWSGELEDPPTKQIGTLFTSTTNLSACALGASMLSLPYAMSLAGPLLTLQFLLIFAIFAFCSAQALVEAGTKCRKSAYADIVRHYFGFAHAIFAEVLLSVALVVAAISYVVGLVDLLPEMVPLPAGLTRSSLTILTLFFLFPPTLVSSLSTFGPASALATAGCYLQALALVVQLALDPSWNFPTKAQWTFHSLPGLLHALPLISFVYAFHYVLTDTLSELSAPSKSRIAQVNLLSVLVMLGCYIPVALAGYLLHSGEHIGTNLLTGLSTRFPTAIIAKWSIGALLFITYSLFLIPLRRKFEAMLLGRQTEHASDPARVGIAAALNIFVCAVAMSLPNLGLANALAGGCIALIMFFFPGRLMIKMQMESPVEERDMMRFVGGVIFVGVGVVICIVGLFGQLMFGK